MNISRYSFWRRQIVCWMFVAFHDSSRLRIFDREPSELSCVWSVLFWLKWFLEFKSGGSEWHTHTHTLLFHSSRSYVCGADSLLLVQFLILWDCPPGEFVTQTRAPRKILKRRRPRPILQVKIYLLVRILATYWNVLKQARFIIL
jgi:hypothetical protein